MATIADGLPREPWDLTAGLLDRKRSIRDFRVKDYLDVLEADGLQPSALPGQSAPTPGRPIPGSEVETLGLGRGGEAAAGCGGRGACHARAPG